MRNEAALLRAWDDAQRYRSSLRPTVVTAALDSEGDALEPWELAHRPVGLVAAKAMAQAAAWFGGDVEATMACPECASPLQVAIATEDLADLAAGIDPTPFPVDAGGETMRARLPTPADISDIASTGRDDSPDTHIAARCLSRHDGSAVDASEVDAEMIEHLAAEFERRDPLGAIGVEITCPDCGAETEAALDLLAWWWAFVDAHARRVMTDVHRLALAYGWSETESLAVGPLRRAAYLELVG